jgi:hypothetical protein
MDINISYHIKKLREEYLINSKSLNCYADINKGSCWNFATELEEEIQRIYDTDIEFYIDPDEMQKMGEWTIDLMKQWNIKLPRYIKWDEIPKKYHVWVYYNGKHYDAECPEGVESFLDLPIYKRIFRR